MTMPRGHGFKTPGELAGEYRRLGRRLLNALAEPGAAAERRGDQIVLARAGSAVSLAAGMPTGVLAELLSAGAVECRTRLGIARFTITEAGRARLKREQAEADRPPEDTPYAAPHRDIATREIAEADERRTVRVNLREDPLEVFRRGGRLGTLVGHAELEAGERFQRDLMLAEAVPRVTANWSRIAVDGAGYRPGMSVPEAITEARGRVERALRAVGPDFSGILMDTLGFGQGIEALEKQRALPARSGKVVLGLALRDLARHYGLANSATGAASQGLRHWGAADCRPSMGMG
jgi:hypothetical protein